MGKTTAGPAIADVPVLVFIRVAAAKGAQPSLCKKTVKHIKNP